MKFSRTYFNLKGDISMGNFTVSLLEKISAFYVQQIGGKGLRGISYAFLMKDSERDMRALNNYMMIKQEAKQCGYNDNEVFRIAEVPNGYILDTDLSILKKINTQIAKGIAKQENDGTTVKDILGIAPEKRRKADFARLAKDVSTGYFKNKKDTFEVALFNRNDSNKARMQCKGLKGEDLCIEFKAYAIRHWDINTINLELLSKEGIKIYSVVMKEILPSGNGVRAELGVDRIIYK